MPIFTNSQQPRPLLSAAGIDRGALKAKPYISKKNFSNLTENELKARKLSKEASFPSMSGNTVPSQSSSFFSPQLSTDFLELPQSLQEKRELYKHYYNSDPMVGQAIDLHTELPLSKVRLSTPKPTSCPKGFKSPDDYGRYILRFFEKMCKHVKLFQRLITVLHHFWLDGNVFIFAEDSTVDIPPSVGHHGVRSVLHEDGTTEEVVDTGGLVPQDDCDDREMQYYAKHYRGWDKLVILPMDRVKLTTFSFTDKCQIELIPSERERALVLQAKQGDPDAQKMVTEIPSEILECLEEGRLIPLGNDPDEGSFCFHLKARHGAGEDLGSSILDRCLRTLTYREKLRQAQTQIASRNMTPKRIVWAENLSDPDTDDLREQIDLSLVDPDYTIVTNYEVHWEEIGSRDRLLDLSGEYEITDKAMYAGLGVTESLLNGESSYGGDRVKLEVLNTRYMLVREILQDYVEEHLFKPIARRKGFIEKDEWGDERELYPSLSFTRLALRDNQDTFDALFNLYQKGSVPIDLILEMFNIDPNTCREKLEADMFTVNDPVFNEVTRGIYGEVGRKLAEDTDAVQRIAKYLKLNMTKAAESDGESERFG